MSGFFDEEALVSDGEDDEYTAHEKTKLKKLKQIQSDDSSEEEEDDEDKLREENKGFINDDEDEESGSDSDGGSISRGRKRDRNDDDDDDLDADNLDEDDLDLIEENIGVKLDRKKKFKRLKRISDEDSDDDGNDRDQTSNQHASGDEGPTEGVGTGENEAMDYASGEAEEESDVEDFIVDDDGKPIQKAKKKAIFDDEGLETARDIFGVDFDYDDIANFDDYDQEEEEEEDDDDEYDEEDEALREAKKKRKERRKPPAKTIFEMFEPSELERGHLTDQDHEIRKFDIPERFQLRQIPVTSTRGDGDDRTKDSELEKEANWIYTHAFYKPYISNQEGRDDARMRPRNDHRMIQKIYNALDLIRNSTCEVPFIAFYRKEEVQPELNMTDLSKVYNFDEKWCQLKSRKDSLRLMVSNMKCMLEEKLTEDINAPFPDDVRVITDDDLINIEMVESYEQFNDVYKHFLLYYGKDLPEMRDYVKKKNKEKQKTTRTVVKTIKVMRKIKRKKMKKKANIGDEESDDDDNRSKNEDEDSDANNDKNKSKSRKNIISDSEDDEDSAQTKKKLSVEDDDDDEGVNDLSDDEGFADKDRSDDEEDSKMDEDKPKEKLDEEDKEMSDSEENKKLNGKEKKKLDGEENEKSDGEENEKSDGEENEKSDGEEKEKSDGEENEKSDGEENEKSDGEENEKLDGKEKVKLDGKEKKKLNEEENEKSDGEENEKSDGEENEKSDGEENEKSDGEENEKSDGEENEKLDGEENEKLDGEEKEKSSEEVEKDDKVAEDKEKDPMETESEKVVENGEVNSKEKESDKEEDEEEEVEVEVETEVEEEIEEEPELGEETEVLKKAIRRHEYELLRRCGIVNLTKKFGLTPEQFGENMRDNYQRHEVEQDPENTLVVAELFLSRMCSSPERVLEAGVRMVGWQLACEPLVRHTMREAYFERSRITVKPTPQGIKLIDEHHPLYTIKTMKDKPVTDLVGDQFLRLKGGVEDKLITIAFSENFEGNNTKDILFEMTDLYKRQNEFAEVVNNWNALREKAIEFAYKRILADLKRELSQRLFQESKDHILEQCCSKLYNWLKVAPYNPGDFQDEDSEWSTEEGFRVFAIAYTSDTDQASFGCCIDVDGDCCEHIRMPNLMFRKNAYNERQAAAKEDDLNKIREFMIRRKPHAVVVGGESRDAMMIVEDMQELLKELEEQEQFPKINVEMIENDLAKQYAVSKKGEQDFFDYPPLLRQAISLGRRLQDPLIEFSQLCNPDEELLNLRFHQYQDLINPSELLNALYTEFVNRTNEVGVDLNRAVAYPYTQNLVQFVCGLGPRKANALVKQMKQTNQRLENRNQLVVNFHMGPKVFINCAGFIKIDTNALGDSDNYIEVLDSTRIHPEAYDWARKMAVDALEYEDDEGKPAEALEEILETPDKLSELDLEAFATELHNQGFGKKNTTLYDIRHELNHRYKDFRVTFRSPGPEEMFNMLTKESPDTFYIGKLVQPMVTHFIHRKPRGDQLDNANPVRNEESGLWQCPFCLKNDFPELSEVWNHFDAGDCPGQAIGIKVRLDNSISGFISIKNLSDKTVTNPADRVKRGSLIHCRIMKIDPDKFSVELTSRTSDLQDHDNKWKAPKDPYYDYEHEEGYLSQDKKRSEKKKTTYHKRVIAHPDFRNIDYNEAEKVMETLEQGDYIIRPSSKGVDHLTATWKVTEKIYQHIDIREQEKLNDFSLGRKLFIANEEFEDLDEIITRYINPLSANVRQILEYKYYKESLMGEKEKANELLKEEKKKNPKNIPYIFSPLKTLPGKFLLSYLPRVKVIHEYVTVSPDGFRFRHSSLFTSLPTLLKWFKANFRKLSQGLSAATPGMMSTRTPYMGGTTPNVMRTDSMKSANQNLPSHLYNMPGAASNTPHYGAATPSAYSSYSNYAQTPYTPSGQTPFMTPYNTPGPSTTPRYGSQTPTHNTNYAPGGRTPQHSSQSSSLHRPMPPPGLPRMNSNSHTNSMNMPGGRNEQQDWSKAAEAWAKARSGRSTPRTDGRSTPRHSESGRYASSNYGDDRRNSRYDDRGHDGEIRTPHYEDRNHDRPYYDYDVQGGRNTPRSVRSTPKTIHSPTNMSIGGDQTPLYDE